MGTLGGEGPLGHPLGDDLGQDRSEVLDHRRDGQQVELRVARRVELVDELGLGVHHLHRVHDRRELVSRRGR